MRRSERAGRRLVAASLVALGAAGAIGCGPARPRMATTLAATEHSAGAGSATDAAGEDAVTYSEAEVAAVLDAHVDDLASCVPFSSAGTMPIDIVVTADGRLVRDDSTLMSATVTGCVDEALAAIRMPRTARLGRSVSYDLARAWHPADARVPPEELTRQALTEVGASLGWCTRGSSGVVITVAWAESGELGASIPFASGTAAEACVREVVRRLSIPAPGRAGVLEYVIVPR